MPGTTVPYGLPYPLGGEAAGPEAVQSLAEAADALYTQIHGDYLAALGSMHAIKLRGSTTTVASGATTELTFNTVNLDTPGWVDLAADAGGITVQETGRYYVWAGAAWDTAVSGGNRATQLRVNNVQVAVGSIVQPTDPITVGGASFTMAWTGAITAGQRVNVLGNNGAASTTFVSSCHLALLRIG